MLFFVFASTVLILTPRSGSSTPNPEDMAEQSIDDGVMK